MPCMPQECRDENGIFKNDMMRGQDTNLLSLILLFSFFVTNPFKHD
jgi:hypothetical protein